MTIAIFSLVLIYLGYNLILFKLIATFLNKSHPSMPCLLSISLLNTLVAVIMTITDKGTALGAYVLLAVILFVEFAIVFRDKHVRSLFCMLTCFVHIMAIRSLCVALFALALDRTIFAIVDDPLLLVVSALMTFLLLSTAILLLLKFVSAKSMNVLGQHSVQLRPLIIILVLISVYLLLNTTVYNAANASPSVLSNQIIIPITILICLYVVFFFAIRTNSLLSYKEQSEKEHLYRMSIDKDVFRIIEANFSQNLLISGFEEYEARLGDMVHEYSNMLAFMIQETVHILDHGKFLKFSSPQSVVDEFKSGRTELCFDYRRLMTDNEYVWMRILMVLFQDEDSEDVRGFVQIKNIDIEKKQQLKLQYMAERDLLTGLYNKITTEQLIKEYMNTSVTPSLTGALFIIDIDDFKTVNDQLGHLYGDAILSELSDRLHSLFRENDIVGRIGGDEFIVFAKGLVNCDMIIQKALEVCNAFLKNYKTEQNRKYVASSSVGISLFPANGTDFETLFKCADIALYAAKAKGKNGYSFYEKEHDSPYVSTRTEIDTHGVLQKTFKDNRIEYVFRLLYGSEDTTAAIGSVLKLIANNFGFSRANIFEFNEFSTQFSCVFEWCAEGIDSVSHQYIDLPLSSFDFIISDLEKHGGMFVATPKDFPEYAQESYTSIGIKSIVHFSIKERDTLIGVIAFQNCTDEEFSISNTTLEELRVICQVFSVFMAKQLSNNREQMHRLSIEAVVDNTNSIAYVIDIDNFDVLYENQNVSAITGHSSIGTKCHRSYRGLDSPCDDCPLSHLSEENERCTLELYTEKFNLYTMTSAALIEWGNGKKAMLISSVDVSEYKKQEMKTELQASLHENFSKYLTDLLALTKIGTWDWDVQTGKVIYSDAWAQILGYKTDELAQNVETWERMVFPDDLIYANEQIARHFRGEDSIYEAEFRMLCKDGTTIWAQDKGYVTEVDGEGKPLRFVGVLQDVSRIKNAEMLLKENQETLDIAVNVSELGTWDWDIPGNRIKYNDEYLHMLGLSQEDMDGSLEEWADTNHPDDLPNTLATLDDYISGKTSKYVCEIRMKHKDGHYIWTRDVGRIVARDANGNPTRILGGHLNIDAQKRTQEKLKRLAYFDELTGLPNLSKFKIEASHILEQYRNKAFIFAKIDIVNFKMVNDIFGNQTGDTVIKMVGDLLSSLLKEQNQITSSFARIHDDVFILLTELQKQSNDGIGNQFQWFEDTFNKQISSVLQNHQIKFRYGRYFPAIGDTNVDNAIECTTLALSKAKTNTLTGTFDYDLSIKQQIRHEIDVTNKMQQALDNGEFIVYLQGKYSLIHENLCGAESLARWKNDDNTVIPPMEFIPIFEQNGFIIKLDMFMYTQCCALLSSWKKEGLALIPVSVNFSRKHLTNKNFAAELAAIAKQYDVEPQYLEIELTETIVLDSNNNLKEFINSLHSFGFQISMDDFGTAYSSLGVLKNLDIDTIKLDRSFFLDAQENAKAHSVLSNMLNMAIDLGIKTVAEGVEEKAHVGLLRKLNCDMIQGYYFGRPIPVAEFTPKMHQEISTEPLTAATNKVQHFNVRKNNELLIDMMDSMPLAFTLWDKNICIVHCNKESATLVGFKTEAEMMEGLFSVIPEFQPDGSPSLQVITERIQLAFEHGYGRYSSWHFQHVAGHLLPCEVTLVRIINKGEFMVACYVRDMRPLTDIEN